MKTQPLPATLRTAPAFASRVPLAALLAAATLAAFAAVAGADTIADRKAAVLGDHVTAPFPDPAAEDPATRFMGRTAYALAAYQTNTNLVQADAYIASLHDDAELVISHDSNLTASGEIPCFFAMPLLTRIYLDPLLMSRMSPAAAAKLRELMYWFVDYRSVVADAAAGKLWMITYTENHNAIRKTTYLLIAQAMMNDSANYGPDFKLADGRTVREHYLAWNAYWKEFLRQSATKGLQLEIASPQYEKYTVACWYNLRDLAGDPATRAQADQFLTLYWTDVAHEFLPGTGIRGASGLRMYQGTYLTRGAMYSFRPWLHMYDWHGTATGAASHPMILCAAASGYTPPAIVRAIATNEAGAKTPHLYSSRRMGRRDAAGDTNTMIFPSHVRRDSWWTPDYVMGSMTFDSTQTYARIASQSRFFSIAFNSGVNDRLVIKAWGTFSGDLAEFWGVTGACHRNVLLAARDLDSADAESCFTSTRLFLGGALAANQTTDPSGWIFTYAGNGYVGIWVGAGAASEYTWDTTSTADGKYLDMADSWSPMLVQCGRAADYAGFDAFKAALVANPPAYDAGAGVLSYTSRDGDTFTIARQNPAAALPTINGQARPQNPAESYLSPHLNAIADADEMTVSYPGYDNLVLDFSYSEISRLAGYAPETNETTYVTTSQTLRDTAGDAWTAASGARPYSATAPLSPATGYTGPVFYGGFEASVAAAAVGAFDTAQVRNANPADAPRIQFTTTAVGAGSISFLFAMPLSAPAALASLTVSGQSNRSSGTGNAGAQYVAVKIGSDWYINNTPVEMNATAKPYTFQNLHLATWASYNPAAGLAFPGAGTLDLTGVGAVSEVALLTTMTWNETLPAGAKIIDFISFQVTGEPASASVPAITSATTATATAGTAFTYTITADNSPAGFAAAGLPAGLILNPISGVIAGAPAESGVFNITLTATNSAGASPPVTLVLTVNPGVLAAYAPGAPGTGETAYVTASQTLRDTAGAAWTAASGARPYSATAPLSPATGYTGPVFYGGFEAGAGAAAVGAFDTAIVRNASSDAPRIQFTTTEVGAGSISFLFAMPLSAPAALASLTVSGQSNRSSGAGNGGALYVAVKIGADWYVNNAPVEMNATQKPYTFQNLHLATWAPYNPAAGLAFPGAGAIDLTGDGAVGEVALLTTLTWNETLPAGAKVIDFISFQVTGDPLPASANVPAITSATSVTATTGADFTYVITASNLPDSFDADGLPAGLLLNAATGVISGAPEASGIYNITLTATNSAGTSPPVTLVLTVTDSSVLAAYAPDAPGTPEANYVTINKTLRAVDGATWTAGPRAFSDSAPLSPLPPEVGVSGYSGPEFFGGFDVGDAATVGTFDVAQVRNATSDAPRVQFTTSAAGAGSFSFLFAMPLSALASLSSLEVSGQSNRSTGTGHNGAQYIAVKTGSAWYVSNAPVGMNAAAKPYTFQNLHLATWAPYNPAANLNFPGAGTLHLDPATNGIEAVALLTTMTWDDQSAWGSQKIIDFVSLKVMGRQAVLVPAITSAANATATVGTAFTYAVTASNSPTGFAAGGLPDGLALDSETGVISGTPEETGVFNVALSATNANGAGPSATLVLTVNPPAVAAPVITSAGDATATVGAAFTYTITADNQPTGFTADCLPDGLTLDPETGVISGTPAVTGSFAVIIGASNAIGSDSRQLVIRVTVSQSEIGTVVPPGGGLGSPAATVFDSAGNSYIADIASGEIKKVTADGTVTTFAAIPQFAALAADAAGNFYTAGNDGNVRKVLADGTVVSPALATGVTTPGGIAVGPDGTVYVSKTAANTIIKITAGGTVTTLAGSGAAGSADSATGAAATFHGPTGLALNPATNRLYVADTVNCTIREINLATGAVTTVAGQPGVSGDTGSAGGNGKAADGSFNTPEALAIDSTGLLYIADTGNNLIRGFDPVSGALVTLAGDTGTTTLNAPAGLAFASTGGFLHVADTGNNALRVVTIAPLFATKLADRTVPSGSSVTLDGTAWASPAADYLWTFNNTTPVGNTATLTLSGGIADTGVYKVVASNIAGTGTAGMRLTVYENYQREGILYRSEHDGAGAPGAWLLAGMGLFLVARRFRLRQKAGR